MPNQPNLNEELFSLLDGRSLADKARLAMTLHTVGEDGYPHQAMVGAGEVLAESRERLRIALWIGTGTTGNLLRTGKALLAVVYGGVSYAIRLDCEPLPELDGARHPRARFAADIVDVRADTAKYAELTSGITIVLHDAPAVVERWIETLEELKQ
ncbi:pyridoxamine 5'-phosphate oxidase family protein [Saccharibacillus sp. CPCC 101409]|uniref:pyridoxamine 5'-phosphate oxidase family protein n=1 Tax=Saccharibacillus sp. CPCC 101409 TaxID=3058041 RepID=UPI0026722752|nr:pyridoxamine 5'-phosphate oxidase family protein [Saccharibacillus sp. CPCC 101409]MDO3408290.1 pyridoxamine 5'-phosphate oxidase family protein [Saccharibacillus sp. CPCC 101409]